MNFPRRQFLQVAAAGGAVPALPWAVSALDYPARPVRLLVGFAAGGPLDTSARLIGQWLSKQLGQQFIIENRPGAGTNLATEAVVQANPDGYTLLECSASNAWNMTLYNNLSFDFLRDIAPVASVRRAGGITEVNPSVPATTVAEFIAYAKANPGKINMATSGPGSASHLYGELFKKMTGVNIVTVNYRSSALALPDLIGGEVQVMFDVVISSIGHIRTGKLRPLGVTTVERLQVLPDVPPIGDFVPGYEASSWDGISAPADTPPEIITTLNREVNAALADPGFKATLADLGVEPFSNSPAAFGKFIAHYTEKWGKVIRHQGGVTAGDIAQGAGTRSLQQKLALFDHLVGTAEQRDWEGDAERLGSLEVKDQLDFRRLLDWQIGRLFTLQNSTSIDADQTVRIGKTASIAHQATSRDKFSVWINRRHRMACCQRDELIRTCVEERIVADN